MTKMFEEISYARSNGTLDMIPGEIFNEMFNEFLKIKNTNYRTLSVIDQRKN